MKIKLLGIFEFFFSDSTELAGWWSLGCVQRFGFLGWRNVTLGILRLLVDVWAPSEAITATRNMNTALVLGNLFISLSVGHQLGNPFTHLLQHLIIEFVCKILDIVESKIVVDLIHNFLARGSYLCILMRESFSQFSKDRFEWIIIFEIIRVLLIREKFGLEVFCYVSQHFKTF